MRNSPSLSPAASHGPCPGQAPSLGKEPGRAKSDPQSQKGVRGPREGCDGQVGREQALGRAAGSPVRGAQMLAPDHLLKFRLLCLQAV